MEINTNRDFTPVEMNVGDTKGYVVNYEGSKETDRADLLHAARIRAIAEKEPDQEGFL